MTDAIIVPDLRGAVIQQILAGRHKQCPVMLQADAPAGMIDSGNRQAIDAYPPPKRIIGHDLSPSQMICRTLMSSKRPQPPLVFVMSKAALVTLSDTVQVAVRRRHS